MSTANGVRTRGLIAAAIAAGLLGAGVPATAGAQAPGEEASPEGAAQTVATLSSDRVVRAKPRTSARRVSTIPARRPLTRVRTVLPVLAVKTAEGGGPAWLRVTLPGRPNGRTGWIMAKDAKLSTTPWRLTVTLASRTVEVRYGGQIVRRFRAVIGAPSTPTPRGDFFVEESVSIGAQAPGGPYALALSARSAVLQEFNGGPGQIAIHGSQGLSGALGSAVSHGCIRVSGSAISWLAARIDAGTPITVR
jgi:lipoprotein-anchoring transpeptidase ErfK/SrfK